MKYYSLWLQDKCLLNFRKGSFKIRDLDMARNGHLLLKNLELVEYQSSHYSQIIPSICNKCEPI